MDAIQSQSTWSGLVKDWSSDKEPSKGFPGAR